MHFSAISSAVAPAAASLRKHPSANILVRGQHDVLSHLSSASLSLPSHPPPCRQCPPRLTQSVDDALTPPAPPFYGFLGRVVDLALYETKVLGSKPLLGGLSTNP